MTWLGHPRLIPGPDRGGRRGSAVTGILRKHLSIRVTARGCDWLTFGAVSALEGITVLAGTLGAGCLSRLAGIIPVLAVQGGGYVVAGLAMLAWFKEEPGEPAGAGARSQGEPALVAGDG